jgi:hypothetical protein
MFYGYNAYGMPLIGPFGVGIGQAVPPRPLGKTGTYAPYGATPAFLGPVNTAYDFVRDLAARYGVTATGQQHIVDVAYRKYADDLGVLSNALVERERTRLGGFLPYGPSGVYPQPYRARARGRKIFRRHLASSQSPEFTGELFGSKIGLEPPVHDAIDLAVAADDAGADAQLARDAVGCMHDRFGRALLECLNPMIDARVARRVAG